MARPEKALIDLAAGRDPGIRGLTPELFESAVEHRMEGLLYTWAASFGLLDGTNGSLLAEAETRNWARNKILAVRAVQFEADAAEHHVDICFYKGVALESQVYARTGERPTTDLDVIVRSGTIEDICTWVRSLQPRHLWVPALESLVSGRHIQAIDLVVGGVQVDIHFDPLKLEIVKTRAKDALLSRIAPCDVGPGTVTGLDPESSLVLALLHLNKDRFRRLIGFADVARLIGGVRNWDWMAGYASKEGLTVPLLASLEVVSRTLDIAYPEQLPQPRTRRLWRLAWPDRNRLLGREGVVRFRYRQMLIPMFSAGRWGEALAGLARRIFPPPAMLRAFYHDVDGSYLRVLVFGRLVRRVRRARQRRAARDDSNSHTP